MTDALQRLADLSVLVFVVSSMLAMGMSQRLAEVVAPLRRPRTIVLALVVNFVLSPLLALALIRIIPLQPAHATGLLLLSAAAGAPFLPKLAEISGGNLAYSVALMMLLMGGSTLFMPSVLALIAPGLESRSVGGRRAALRPHADPPGGRLRVGARRRLLAGTPAGFRSPPVQPGSGAACRPVDRAQPGDPPRNARQLRDRNLYGLPARNHDRGLSARRGRRSRRETVFALGTGCRNLPAALVVARANSDDPAVTVMLIVAFVVSLIVLLARSHSRCAGA